MNQRTKNIFLRQLFTAIAAVVLLLATETECLRLYSGNRDESLIVVKWNESASTDAQFRISYIRESEPPEMLVHTAWQRPDVTSYEIRHLPSNTKFNICVTEQDTTLDIIVTSECISLATVPVMLATSILSIICVIGYFGLSIILGYCCWKRKKNKLKAAAEEDDRHGDREALQPRSNKLSIEDPEVAVYMRDGHAHLMKYSPKNSTFDDEMYYCGTRV